MHPKDKRPVFIYPWEGAAIIGTTDLDHTDNLDSEAKINEHEVNYLLEAVNSNFSDQTITINDIISTFSGVRPVISSDKYFINKSSKKRSLSQRVRQMNDVTMPFGLKMA